MDHQCGPQCWVQPEFGNVYRCHSSGLTHICDKNCNQRIPWGRYSTICKISRREHAPFDSMDDREGAASRKRSCDADVALGECQQQHQGQQQLYQQQQQQQVEVDGRAIKRHLSAPDGMNVVGGANGAHWGGGGTGMYF